MAEPGALRSMIALARTTRYRSTSGGGVTWLNRRRHFDGLWQRRDVASAAAVASAPPSDELSHQLPQQPWPTPHSAAQSSRRREAVKNAKPFSEFLTDSFQRQHDYLRISITERCNLRCLYCMPEEGVPLSPSSHLLTSPEIFYLSSLFVSQGVNKIRLTGGEPTVRRDIVPLMKSIGSLRPHGLRELCLTTNGISLHRKLDSMAEAGLTGVNLSLDTLDPFQFQIMTRRKGFEAVMHSVDRILEMNKLGARIKLKINCVVMRGLNEREIIPFVELGREKDIEVRFIEYMPFDGNKWSQGKMLSFQEMLNIIRERYPDMRKVQDHRNDTSKTYEVPGFVGKFGFITSMTSNFCGTCNRLRITSDGNLKVCLFGNSEVSLRDLLRNKNGGNPIDEEALEALKQLEMDSKQAASSKTSPLKVSEQGMELLEVIGLAVKRKKAKHAGMGELENMKNRPMILIGKPVLPEALNAPPSSSPYALSQLSRRHSTLQNPSRPSFHRFPNRDDLRRILTSSPRIRRFSSQARFSRPAKEPGPSPTSLPHLTAKSTAHMIRIASKPATHRLAVAVGHVLFSTPHPLPLIRSSSLKKGDVLAVARVAGIMAAKRTADLVPLCHPLSLSGVEVELETVGPEQAANKAREMTESGLGEFGGVTVRVNVECFGPTGVEMEALTGVMGAALTVVDMCKGVDKGLRIEGVRVVLKKGGRSGEWREVGFTGFAGELGNVDGNHQKLEGQRGKEWGVGDWMKTGVGGLIGGLAVGVVQWAWLGA
ncbi:MAG: hypothetical protein M1837_006992 [Sclerophora amabilis]|nr:MAG: hypothetical protein M1837_006992 [Sclerophora amabilis]